MKRSIQYIVIIAVCTFSLTGCWGRIELPDLGIVTITGVDIDENGMYEVVLHVVAPIHQGGGNESGAYSPENIWMVSAKGKSLMEAVRNIRARSSAQFKFSHSRVIIIGKKVAEEGVDKVIDFFARNIEFRYTSYIFLAREEAKEILSLYPEVASTLSLELLGMAENQRLWSQSHASILKDFLIQLREQKGGEVLGAVYSKQLETKQGNNEPELQPKIGTQTKRSSEGVVSLEGIGVLKNGVLKGFLDREETRGYLFITGQGREGVLWVPMPQAENAHVSVSLDKSKSHIEVLANEEGKIQLNVKIIARGEIVEQSDGMMLLDEESLPDTELIKEMEKNVAKVIVAEMRKSLQKVQKEYEVDIYDFHGAIYRKYPKLWKEKYEKDWENLYPKLKVNLYAKVNITEIGTLNTSILQKKAEGE